MEGERENTKLKKPQSGELFLQKQNKFKYIFKKKIFFKHKEYRGKMAFLP